MEGIASLHRASAGLARRIVITTMTWAALSILVVPAQAQTVVLSAPALDLKASGTVYAVARAADGKLVIGGEFEEVNDQPRSNIARLNADGSLDTSWNPGADQAVYTLAVDAQGIVYAGGDFALIGGLQRFGLARLDPITGAADSSWDLGLNGGAMELLMHGSGWLYAAGSFSSAGGQPHANLMRVDTVTGSVDHAWLPSADFRPEFLAIGDGWVYAGGTDVSAGGTPTGGLARFSVSGAGARDLNWLPAPNERVEGLASDASHLYVAGRFSQIGGLARNRLVRIALNSVDGVPDSAWNPAADADVKTVAVDASGVYVSGDFASIGGQPRRRLAKLSLSDAAALSNWNPDAGPVAWHGAILATGDGGAIFGGSMGRIGGALHPGIVRTLPDGTADASFAARVLMTASAVLTLPLSDGGYLIGGDFLYVGGAACPFLLRLNADRSWDSTWSVDIDSTVSFAREAVGTSFPIVIGGGFERLDGNVLKRVARLALNSSVDAAWNPQFDSAANTSWVNALQIEGAHLFIGGLFDSVDGQQRRNLAKLSLGSGELDATWSANTDGRVFSIAGDSAGAIFVGGDFSIIDGVARQRLAKLDSAGTGVVDTDWSPAAGNAFVRRLLFDAAGNHLYVAGAFNSLGGNSAIRRLGRVSSIGNGAVDAGWVPNPGNGSTRTLLLDPSGWLYFGGYFSSVAGLPIAQLARTDVRNVANGAPDVAWSFQLAQPIFPGVFSIAPISGGGILASGFFDSVNGLARGSLAAVGTQLDPVFGNGFE